MTKANPKSLSAEKLNEWLKGATQKPILIDVREEQEIAIAPFPEQVIHLPLSQSQEWGKSLSTLIPNNKPIVVLCHAGIRSWQFSTWLIEQGWKEEIWNLDGGIDSWSINIDPSVPRY